MREEAKNLKEVIDYYAKVDPIKVNQQLERMIEADDMKVVVLDDDPTGVQTIHGISVYTDWEPESVLSGFKEDSRMFFILTNSRSFTYEETVEMHKQIGKNILAAAKQTSKRFIVISRGDSTLRGYYPIETQVIKESIEQHSAMQIDGEVIMPFFLEGGRYTAENIHYVAYGDELIPAGQTEFAKDKTFGYKSSHLGEWIEEKSKGVYKAENVTYISLDDIRKFDIEKIKSQLMEVNNFNKVVVNALDYIDVKVFVIALLEAMSEGKNFMFRSAAALTKVLGGVVDKPLLMRSEMISNKKNASGLIIVGSHVQKTTDQLNQLKECDYVEMVEFNQHLVLNPDEFEIEINRVVDICEKNIRNAKTTAVYTRRDRLDLNTGNKEEELKIAVKISNAVTSIVQKLKERPDFIIAKGGITSSDIGTKGLGVKKAVVAGQIRPGIPVWITGEESKFSNIAYVIFPGNVGAVTDLKATVDILMGQ